MVGVRKARGAEGEGELFRIHSLRDARAAFGPLSAEERAWRSRHAFAPLLTSARSRLGIGEHDRGEAFMFGDGPYPSSDEVSLARHFPISVKKVFCPELTLTAGCSIDYSVAAGHFPWDTATDELYLQLSIGTLKVEDGELLVRGNLLIFCCNEVIGLGSSPPKFRIRLIDNGLPIQRRRKQPNAGIGRAGLTGVNGVDGTAPQPRHSLFKTTWQAGTPPQAGSAGGDAQPGASGDNGGMLYLADLRFGSITGFAPDSIHVEAKAGDGFPGKPGGQGGAGGCGGNALGSPSCATPQPGAAGGPGGRGGDGGLGGNGGLSSPVFLSLPAGTAKVFRTSAFPSKGAPGGIGGSGGAGGIGGTGTDGDLGPKGISGLAGNPGQPGRSRPAPQIFIYERKSPDISAKGAE